MEVRNKNNLPGELRRQSRELRTIADSVVEKLK
jgi:hypothetical protein